MANEKFQRVVFQPSTHEGMRNGVDKIVNAVRPTLGPFPRVVAIEGMDRRRLPEILDESLINPPISSLPVNFKEPSKKTTLGTWLISSYQKSVGKGPLRWSASK